MGKKDFRFNQEMKEYKIVEQGFNISISENALSNETIALAYAVVKAYPQKVDAIAEFLADDDGIKMFYDDISMNEIITKLHEPEIIIDETGGVLSYCNHELDEDHIIDLEFGGILESFYYVSIDG